MLKNLLVAAASFAIVASPTALLAQDEAAPEEVATEAV